VRGGVKPVIDTSNAFKLLRLDISKYGATQEDIFRADVDTAKAISAITDATVKAATAQQIWGRGWAKQIELLTDADENIKAAEKTITDFGLGVTKAEEEQSKAFLAARYHL
jgi:hypothetical protein